MAAMKRGMCVNEVVAVSRVARDVLLQEKLFGR
jgi:hypothetical protein